MKPEEQPITANPDTFEYDIEDDADFIIMGCDGVWEVKSNEEMVAWVYKKLEGQDLATVDLKSIVKDLLNENLSKNPKESSKLNHQSFLNHSPSL